VEEGELGSTRGPEGVVTRQLRISALALVLASSCWAGCDGDPVSGEYELGVEYSLDEDGYATIYMPEGRGLSVLLLTDVQLTVDSAPGKNTRTLELIERLLSAVEPDLVVLPGDLTKTYMFDNWADLTRIGDLLERHQVLWMPMFGNHDCHYSWEYGPQFHQVSKREAVAGMRARYPLCLISEGDCADGVGNYFVNIKDGEGDVIYTLCAFDAVRIKEHEYVRQRTDAQIEWYAGHLRAISALRYGEGSDALVPSMVFAHFPVKQLYDMYREVEGTDAHLYGDMLEGDHTHKSWDDGFFEAAVELGSTTAMFFGHDHKNDASIVYDGIRLTYGQHSSHSDYYRTDEEQSLYGDARGGTIITIRRQGEDVGFEVSRILEEEL
jgi:hypothetical protein